MVTNIHDPPLLRQQLLKPRPRWCIAHSLLGAAFCGSTVVHCLERHGPAWHPGDRLWLVNETPKKTRKYVVRVAIRRTVSTVSLLLILNIFGSPKCGKMNLCWSSLLWIQSPIVAGDMECGTCTTWKNVCRFKTPTFEIVIVWFVCNPIMFSCTWLPALCPQLSIMVYEPMICLVIKTSSNLSSSLRWPLKKMGLPFILTLIWLVKKRAMPQFLPVTRGFKTITTRSSYTPPVLAAVIHGIPAVTKIYRSYIMKSH